MWGASYREVNDWSGGAAVRKDIVIAAQDCTREGLIALAKHLSFRFMVNPVVVVNIFDDEKAALAYDKQRSDEDEGKDFVFAHWPARYLKSWARGLNQLVIYPGRDHHRPERVAL